jgi:addiction module HigA family antidote
MYRARRNEYLPETVSPPGETLQELLDERHMTQVQLADRTGRPKKTINEIIKGKAPITPETALQLERVLGVTASFWNARESHYQQYLAREHEREQLTGYTDWLKELPIAEMAKMGWIERRNDDIEQIREILSYFGVASPRQWKEVLLKPQVSFRHARTFESSPAHLGAWLRRGEVEAQAIVCCPYDRGEFETALQRARRLTVDSDLQALRKVCAGAGVAVVFVPQLPKSRVSGATRWLSPTKAVIQLSVRYRTDDHLWFTFFHEAGHILLHGKRDVFIEYAAKAEDSQLPQNPSTATEEAEADAFASEFLIQAEKLQRFRAAALQKRISENMVRQLADELGIAPGIVVGRLQFLGWLPYTHLNKLTRRFTWPHETD